MRQGIHLGERRAVGAPSRWLWPIAAALCCATVFHGWSVIGIEAPNRDRLRRIAESSSPDSGDPGLSESEADRLHADVIPRVVSLMQVGAPAAPSASGVLSVVSAAVPPGIEVQAFGLSASGRIPNLTLSVRSQGSPAVAEFQLALEREPMIQRTEQLEERVDADGRRVVRLRVQLASKTP